MVLEPHLRAPVPIHGPDRCFRDQTVGRARRDRGIELHQMLAARNVLHSVLHELDRLVVLQTEEAGRAHEITLAQTMAGHLVVVAFEAEHRPLHYELVRTSRYDLAHAERIHLALDDQIRPDGRHRHGPGAVELLDEVHETRLRERHAVAIGAHLLLGIAGNALALR